MYEPTTSLVSTRITSTAKLPKPFTPWRGGLASRTIAAYSPADPSRSTLPFTIQMMLRPRALSFATGHDAPCASGRFKSGRWIAHLQSPSRDHHPGKRKEKRTY